MIVNSLDDQEGICMGKIYDPIPKDILCRHTTTMYIDPNYHHHDGCEIYVLLDGDVNYYVEQECYHMKRGNVLAIRSGEYHRPQLNSEDVYERVHVNFRTSYFKTLSSDKTDLNACFEQRPFGKPTMMRMNEQQLREFIVLVHQLERVKENTSYGQDLMTMAYSIQILVKINQLFFESQDVEQRNIMPVLVSDTMKYIEDHITETITLQDMSECIFHNGDYISRCFKKATGLSIRQYILMKRIDIAKSYLKEGKELLDCCMLSGFNNYSNFSRTFHNLVGCTPKQYQSGGGHESV